MRGDGHTASFGANSACIDTAVLAYLEALTLPRKGAACSQEVPFAAHRGQSRRTIQELLEQARLR
jgi:TAP-like protein